MCNQSYQSGVNLQTTLYDNTEINDWKKYLIKQLNIVVT